MKENEPAIELSRDEDHRSELTQREYTRLLEWAYLTVILLTNFVWLSEDGETEQKTIVSNFGVAIMIAKGMIGLGIFSLPHLCKYIGVLGFIIMYPALSLVFLFLICLVVHTANEVGYKGIRWG